MASQLLSPLRVAVEYRSIEELKRNPRNARVHPPKQIKQLVRSMKTFGFLVPLLVDGEDVIVAGHGRLEAARALGMKEVPVISVAHLSPEQLAAYTVADNRLAENAEWDRKLLGEQLLELSRLELDFSLDVIGFDMGEIDVLISEVTDGSAEQEEPVPDETGLPAIAQVGDVWLLGKHRLICGDALDPDNYDRLMQGEKAQLVFTDPPYNVPIQGHVSGKGRIKHREFPMACGEMTHDEFSNFLRTAAGLMAKYSVDGSIHYICMDWRHDAQLQEACAGIYSSLVNICVWSKSNAGMGSLWRSRHEFVLVFKNGKSPHINNVQLGVHGRSRSNIWEYPSANSFGRNSEEGRILDSHSCPKPVQLVADAMLDCSNRSGIVLDPFTGSGTTLIAAERTGRVFRGMELDPLYVDTIIRRWQSMTGEYARHEASGLVFAEMADVRASSTVASAKQVEGKVTHG